MEVVRVRKAKRKSNRINREKLRMFFEMVEKYQLRFKKEKFKWN